MLLVAARGTVVEGRRKKKAHREMPGGPSDISVLLEVCNQSYNSQYEKNEYAPHDWANVLSLLCANLEENPSDNCKHDTCSD